MPDYIFAINVAIIMYALADSPMNSYLRSTYVAYAAIIVLGIMTYFAGLEKVMGIDTLISKLKTPFSYDPPEEVARTRSFGASGKVSSRHSSLSLNWLVLHPESP